MTCGKKKGRGVHWKWPKLIRIESWFRKGDHRSEFQYCWFAKFVYMSSVRKKCPLIVLFLQQTHTLTVSHDWSHEEEALIHTVRPLSSSKKHFSWPCPWGKCLSVHMWLMTTSWWEILYFSVLSIQADTAAASKMLCIALTNIKDWQFGSIWQTVGRWAGYQNRRTADCF